MSWLNEMDSRGTLVGLRVLKEHQDCFVMFLNPEIWQNHKLSNVMCELPVPLKLIRYERNSFSLASYCFIAYCLHIIQVLQTLTQDFLFPFTYIVYNIIMLNYDVEVP